MGVFFGKPMLIFDQTHSTDLWLWAFYNSFLKVLAMCSFDSISLLLFLFINFSSGQFDVVTRNGKTIHSWKVYLHGCSVDIYISGIRHSCWIRKIVKIFVTYFTFYIFQLHDFWSEKSNYGQWVSLLKLGWGHSRVNPLKLQMLPNETRLNS